MVVAAGCRNGLQWLFYSVFSTLSGASDTACLEGVVGKAQWLAPDVE